MKPDMPKVITERPRHGMRIKQPKGYQKDMSRIDEDSPSREKIRQKWIKTHCNKQFSERLGPLFRFLQSKIGQSWNDVYSEICQGLANDNQVHRHVLTHVDDFVETKTVMVDGVVCRNDGMMCGSPVKTYGGQYGAMYVHPETGILCKSPKADFRWKKPQRTDVVRLDENTVAKKIDDIWYKLTVAKFDEPSRGRKNNTPTKIGNRTFYRDGVYYVAAFDVAHNVTVISTHQARELYGECIYATSKKQLNGKEIKQFKLAA